MWFKPSNIIKHFSSTNVFDKIVRTDISCTIFWTTILFRKPYLYNNINYIKLITFDYFFIPWSFIFCKFPLIDSLHIFNDVWNIFPYYI